MAAALDAGTAACAAVNAAYFLDRLFSGVERVLSPERAPVGARRLAVATLAVVSLASLVEAAALLAIATNGEDVSLSTAPWAFVRLLPFVGTAAISVLIARRCVLQ